jgi:serine/arginine repetitive matrix protein 1
LSRSPSRERVRRRQGRDGGSRRSPSFDPDVHRRDKRADIVKDRANRDDRRLSRSPERHMHRRRRSPSTSISRSRSRSPRPRRDRKRRRSLPRYAPAGRRRHNTSSISSPDDKGRKRANTSSDEDRSPRATPPQSQPTHDDSTMADAVGHGA